MHKVQTTIERRFDAACPVCSTCLLQCTIWAVNSHDCRLPVTSQHAGCTSFSHHTCGEPSSQPLPCHAPASQPAAPSALTAPAVLGCSETHCFEQSAQLASSVGLADELADSGMPHH